MGWTYYGFFAVFLFYYCIFTYRCAVTLNSFPPDVVTSDEMLRFGRANIKFDLLAFNFNYT